MSFSYFKCAVISAFYWPIFEISYFWSPSSLVVTFILKVIEVILVDLLFYSPNFAHLGWVFLSSLVYYSSFCLPNCIKGSWRLHGTRVNKFWTRKYSGMIFVGKVYGCLMLFSWTSVTNIINHIISSISDWTFWHKLFSLNRRILEDFWSESHW